MWSVVTVGKEKRTIGTGHVHLRRKAARMGIEKIRIRELSQVAELLLKAPRTTALVAQVTKVAELLPRGRTREGRFHKENRSAGARDTPALA